MRDFIFTPRDLETTRVVTDKVLAIALDDFEPLSREASVDDAFHAA